MPGRGCQPGTDTAIRSAISNPLTQAFPRVLRAPVFASAPPPRNPPATLRKTAALMPPPDSSLSLSLKASPFHSFAHLLRLRCSRLRSARVARLGLNKWATAPLRAFLAERQEIAAPAFPIVCPHCPPLRARLRGFDSPWKTTPRNSQTCAPPVALP
jgi:hypothetical protein